MSYMFCCYIKIYRRFISYNTLTLFAWPESVVVLHYFDTLCLNNAWYKQAHSLIRAPCLVISATNVNFFNYKSQFLVIQINWNSIFWLKAYPSRMVIRSRSNILFQNSNCIRDSNVKQILSLSFHFFFILFYFPKLCERLIEEEFISQKLMLLTSHKQ